MGKNSTMRWVLVTSYVATILAVGSVGSSIWLIDYNLNHGRNWGVALNMVAIIFGTIALVFGIMNIIRGHRFLRDQ